MHDEEDEEVYDPNPPPRSQYLLEPPPPLPPLPPPPPPPPAPAAAPGFASPMVAGQIIEMDGRYYVAVLDDAAATLIWRPCAILAPQKPKRSFGK